MRGSQIVGWDVKISALFGGYWPVVKDRHRPSRAISAVVVGNGRTLLPAF
jgi:hypothetical protein